MKHKKWLFLIILILLNIFLIIKSNSILKNSNKKYTETFNAVDSNKNLYFNISDQEEYFYEINIKIIDAEKKALEYMLNNGYTYQSYDNIDQNTQSELYKMSSSAKNKNSIMMQLSQKIYMYYINENLQELYANYQTMNIIPLIRDSLIESVSTQISFIDNNSIPLKIDLNILPFRYSILEKENVIIANLDTSAKKYVFKLI